MVEILQAPQGDPAPLRPAMEWLNYHHLHYFWLVVREGGLAPACERLKLAPSTLSGQLKAFEEAMGEKLLTREGRRLAPTDVGRMVYRYADEIFSLGSELQQALKSGPVGRPLRLAVGVADVVPKLIAHRLLEPALRMNNTIKLFCREDIPERLLPELASHDLDLVLSDSPAPPSTHVRAYNHLLGESAVAFFATEKLARDHRQGFPGTLNGAPMLLPAEHTTLRRSLEHWFLSNDVRPNVIAEFEDSALLKVFGQAGYGIFPAPAVLSREIERQYHVKKIGHDNNIRERFYAISIERKLTHPAIVAISNRAKKDFLT